MADVKEIQSVEDINKEAIDMLSDNTDDDDKEDKK